MFTRVFFTIVAGSIVIFCATGNIDCVCVCVFVFPIPTVKLPETIDLLTWMCHGSSVKTAFFSWSVNFLLFFLMKGFISSVLFCGVFSVCQRIFSAFNLLFKKKKHRALAIRSNWGLQLAATVNQFYRDSKQVITSDRASPGWFGRCSPLLHQPSEPTLLLRNSTTSRSVSAGLCRSSSADYSLVF